MVVNIKLTQGKIAIIDEIDKDLADYKWYALKKEGPSYIYFRAYRKDKRRHISLSRVVAERIIGRELNYYENVDHINHDTLDNRRDNLRICLNADNIRNQRSQQRQKSSRYKGASFHKQQQKWRAQIQIDGKHIHLGYFDSEDEAAFVYNQAAIKYFGQFAFLNQVTEVTA